MDDQKGLDENQFEILIQGLINNRYACCDDFISPDEVIGLFNNIQTLKVSGLLKPSGFGNKINYHQDKTIRGDAISWINKDSINQFELAYINKIEKFISYLNQTCFTAITNSESHYASYDKFSFYKRHLDQFKNDTHRKFSIILYLNDDWKDSDGGVLSLYPSTGIQINISPLGGRMVLFRSDEMEHEVQASTSRERNSIATWLKS